MLKARSRKSQSLIETSIVIALVAVAVIAILNVFSSGFASNLGQVTCALSGGGVACVSPAPSASPTAGTSQSFAAAEYAPSGNSLGDVTATATFTISPDGSCSANTCTATVAGSHTVTATTSDATGHASLTFLAGGVVGLTLSPASASAAPGATQAYTATGIDQYGNATGDLTSTTTFSISSGGSCSANLCTASTAGSYSINGTSSGYTAASPATLTVTASTLSSITISPASASIPSGSAQNYTATGFDQYGNPLGDVTAATTFTISSSGTCTANSCSATTAGSYTVTGTDSGFTATATLTVTAGVPDHILITPASASIAAGTSQAYTATAYDAASNPIGDVTPATTFSITPDGSCNAALCVASVTGAHTVTGDDSGKTATAALQVNASTLDHITISPATASIPAGATQAYVATAFDQYGNSLGTVTPSTTFSASSGSCTAADCTATTAGSVTITGTYSAHTATATLSITAGALASISITPASATIVAGDSQAYTATAYDAYGNPLGDVTASTTFAIAPDGSCTGATCTTTVPGTHTVSASYSSQSATATLTVTANATASITISPTSSTIAAGSSQSYTVSGVDSFGNSTGDLTASTTFTITPDGSCTANTCSATALSSHTVTATYTGHTATATLNITAGALASITISPTSAVIPVGDAQSFTAIAYDAYGNTLGDVTASTSFGITPDGSCTTNSCTATTPGGHTVTGTYSGHSANATLAFTTGPLASITITPASAAITAGGSQAYTAQGFDSFGNSLGDVTSSTSFAITPDGICTGASCTTSIAGTHTVTGNDSGYTANATLTVTAAGPASITITPATAAITAGGSQTYTATAYDQYGNPTANVTSSTTFSISPDGGCTNDTCTASHVGDHTVTGTYSAKTATATLTVTSGTADHISLTPSSATITAGSSQTYTASSYDSFGNLIGDVTSSTTFAIGPDGSCAANSCTASTAGSHTVTGTDGANAATATLAVTGGTLSSITISPASAAITAGSSQAYTATGYDNFGNALGDVTAATTFTISPDGSCTTATCTATVASSHTVTGTDSGFTANATLTVDPAAFNHITISPASSSIIAGSTQSYTATAFDQYNNSRGDVTSSTTFTVTSGASCTTNTCTATVAATYTVTATFSAHTANATLTVGAASLSSITLSPSSASIVAGTAQAYAVTAYDTYGNVRGDDTSVTTFSITPDGNCTANSCTAAAAGSHTVTGNDAGYTATASLSITSGTLASITISPASASVTANATQVYSSTGYDAFGNAIADVTSTTTFAISPDGSCTANSCTATVASSHTVTGTDSGYTANATLTVTAGPLDHLALSPASTSVTAGASQAYTATGLDVYNNSKGDVTAATAFSVSGGTCTAATCTATIAGSHTVTGTDATKTGTASLTVNAGALASITISPASASITAGGSQAYTAQGFDTYSNSLGSVTAATTFSITPDGICTTSTCTSSTAGSHTVTGTDSGHSSTASLQINTGTLASITISPASATISAGNTQAYTATGYDSFGNALGDATAATIFSITPDGSCNNTNHTCTATVAGSHIVTGTDSGFTATASLTVNAGALNHITLTPSSSAITAGGTQAYAAQGFDAFGNPLGDATAATSFSITPDGSCNNTNHTCTAATAGSHTVTGTDNSYTATASLTVNPAGLASITIAPASAGITAGASQAYTAQGFDSFGNALGDVTAATTFTISPDGSCTTNSCTASATGAHTVTGTDSGNTATASLAVNAAGLASIAIAPTNATIVAGATQAYTTQGFDSFGNALGDVTASTTFSVSPNGSCNGALCTATVAGAHTVTGNDSGKTATSTLAVNAGALASITLSPTSSSITAGSSQAYTATGADQYGNSLGDVTTATTFSITPDGSCDNTNHTCTATVAGSHTVTGNDSGFPATATLAVTAGALASITIAPTSTGIAAGATQAYTATGYDSSGNSIGDATAATTFSITPDGSCNNTNHTCTATVAGAHTVTGNDSGFITTATLAVTAAAFDHIIITPTASSIVAGGSQTYVSTSYDVYGNSIATVTASTTFTISPTTSSSCTGAACTSTVAGSHTVTGTYSAKTATSALTVTAGALASITLSPTSSSITADSSQTYVATGFDTYGNVIGTVTGATTFSITSPGTCSTATCRSNIVGSYTVTGTDSGHTATAALTVTVGAVASIAISPTTSVVRTGTAVTYATTGFDQYGNSLGNVTAGTTFTDSAGTCTGASCTNSSDGVRTITATDSTKTATASQTSTTCTLSSVTASLPGAAKESTSVTFTANGGACTGGLTPIYDISPSFADSGWSTSASYATTTATPGAYTVTTKITLTGQSATYATTGGYTTTVNGLSNYDWTTCTLTSVTLPSGVGTGPRWVTSVASWAVTAAGSCTGSVTPSYDYDIQDSSNVSHLDSGQLGNTTSWNWATTTYPNAVGTVKVAVGIMANNERSARAFTTYQATSNTGGNLYWNAGGTFLFAQCTLDTLTSAAGYTPNANPYNVTITQASTCSAGATPTYEVNFAAATQAATTCDTIFATTCNSALINFDAAGGVQTLNGYVGVVGDELHAGPGAVADANGGLSGAADTNAITITNNCWSLTLVSTSNSSDGNTASTAVVTATCNPSTIASYTEIAREDCQATCPPPHCYINNSYALGCNYYGTGGGWGNSGDGAYYAHPSGGYGNNVYTGGSGVHVTVSDEHASYDTSLTCTPSGFYTQPYYDMIITESHASTGSIVTAAFGITSNAVLCYPSTSW